MATALARIEDFILDPRYADVLTLIKAIRNGAVYGAKIRFPHALVMTLLFRSGSSTDKAKMIWKATTTHAQNLALYAFIYKATMLILRQNSLRQNWRGSKEASGDAFFAGLIGGYFVFGRGSPSSVNEQIVIYVFARVVLGLARLSVTETGVFPATTRASIKAQAWPIFASISWGLVMWLFRWYPSSLQPSMRNSMQYIYNNADHWTGLRNFIIHNK